MKELKLISQFMSLEPVTGFNLINNVIRLFSLKRLEIPLEWPIVRHIAQLILTRELNMYFSRLRKEDEVLGFDEIKAFDEEQIDQICFKRGIEIDKQTLEEKRNDLKLWLSISNQRNVPHTLLLYTRINDYCNDLFEISEDEDDTEILRRVSSNSLTL